MKTSNVKTLELTSYDDIFKTDIEREDASREKIIEIPLGEIHSFENHPFKVCDDAAMLELTESIAQNGVLIPGVVRHNKEKGYELISGHRRKRACELAGKETMPVIIRELNDDESIFIMVDSNLQRESLLFSEKAYAYKMKVEAIKRNAGRPTKEKSIQAGINFSGKKSYEIIGDQSGESKNQIFRYIRLTELIDDLMDMVDNKKIAFNPAVELSYLNKDEQILLLDVIIEEEATPSLSQAQRIKKLSQDGKLDKSTIYSVIKENKKEVLKVTFAGDRIRKYFPKSVTPRQVEETIIKLLENWCKVGGMIDKT